MKLSPAHPLGVQVGTFCQKPERRPLFSASSIREAAAHERDPVIQHELRVYFRDVHGIPLNAA